MKKTARLEISNRVAEVRQRCGVSAADLAKVAGVSRQTIYAVESGSYMPNTATGLRLAQALGVRVDELFSLTNGSEAAPTRTERATFLPHQQELRPGQAVQLCQANGKLVATVPAPGGWYLPANDAVVAEKSSTPGTVWVQVNEPREEFQKRILLAGCDPAMGMVARYLQKSGLEMILLHQNSSLSLSLLKQGYTHIAGSHLPGAVQKLFPARAVALITFAAWQEGLVTASGNPKHIKGVADLGRKDVTFVNREAGSGSRALLDGHLKRLQMDAAHVRGYARTVPGHLPAVAEISAGRADCCTSTEAAARFYGLHFIPLETVRYDLVVRKQALSEPGVQLFFDAISQLRFRRKLENLGGYDTAATGASSTISA